jgi:hypothetical protein
MPRPREDSNVNGKEIRLDVGVNSEPGITPKTADFIKE